MEKNDKITPKGERTVNVIMIIGGLILAAIVAHFLFASCAVQKPQKPTIEYRDSIRVEIREKLVHDTTYFEVPVEVEKVVTRDTSSHIIGYFSESFASVSEGYLHHSLITKKQSIAVPVTYTVRDTVIVEKEAEIRTEYVNVEVEKKLTFGQKFKIWAFWWLVALALVGWRRELAALGKWLWNIVKPFIPFIH